MTLILWQDSTKEIQTPCFRGDNSCIAQGPAQDHDLGCDAASYVRIPPAAEASWNCSHPSSQSQKSGSVETKMWLWVGGILDVV